MPSAVIPVQNEAGMVGLVLEHLLEFPFRQLIVVLNGSTDGSFQELRRFSSDRITLLYFPEALGIDLPRAVGAFYAYHKGASSVSFVDGDMTGSFQQALWPLALAPEEGVDLALTSCYPKWPGSNPLANEIAGFRLALNNELGLSPHLALSSPSHGPSAVSRRFLETIPWQALAVPPVGLALAAKDGLKIKIAAKIPHQMLGSVNRSGKHPRLIADTIIGDTLEALSLIKRGIRSRAWEERVYEGYNNERRFDILEKIISGEKILLFEGQSPWPRWWSATN